MAATQAGRRRSGANDHLLPPLGGSRQGNKTSSEQGALQPRPPPTPLPPPALLAPLLTSQSAEEALRQPRWPPSPPPPPPGAPTALTRATASATPALTQDAPALSRFMLAAAKLAAAAVAASEGLACAGGG